MQEILPFIKLAHYTNAIQHENSISFVRKKELKVAKKRNSVIYMGNLLFMFSAILFDLDGTLMNTIKADRASKQSICQKYSIPYDEGYFMEHRGDTDTGYRENNPQKGDINIERVAKDTWQVYMAYARHYNTLFPETQDFLKWCHESNMKMGLYTNEGREELHQSLQLFGLEKYFDHQYTRDDVKKPKPDPAGYLKLMNDLGVSSRECIIIEDSPTGIAAALATGATVAQVDHNNNANKIPGVDYYVHSRKELLEKIT